MSCWQYNQTDKNNDRDKWLAIAWKRAAEECLPIDRGSAKIPLNKRSELIALGKRPRDHINSTYDTVSMETLSSV